MYKKPKYLFSGDKAITIEFGNEISKEINDYVRSMYFAIKKFNIDGIGEIIPTYRSLTVEYNPFIIEVEQLKMEFEDIRKKMSSIQIPAPRIIEIPTIYGGDFGPDLKFVAEFNGLKEKDVIKIHSSVDYLIYMLGFTPGFPYLGGMAENIEAPRLKNPRIKIPEGSVGIAGKQTGIYPIESPGGWRLIGRTPVKLYDPRREIPIVLRAGDYLRFIPIDKKEYDNISDLVNRDKYEINILQK